MTVAQLERRYEILANKLRRKILAGDIPPGGKLPSEAELVDGEGVARGTVRHAIDELIAEGLVVSREGVGHFVRQSKPLVWLASDPERNTSTDPSAGPNDTWSRSVRMQGRTPREEIRTEVAYATEQIAAWLHLRPGEPVSIRRRLRFVDDVPFSTADSFYPRSIVAGTEIEEPGDVLPGVYAVFERLGRAWVRSPDRINSRLPSREEGRLLRIPRGVAVTEIVRRSFDADNIPVRLTRFVLPGDRHVIEYDHLEEPS